MTAPFTVWEGTGLHRALTSARDARAGGDIAGTDRHFAAAVELAGDPAFAAELAAEHVEALRALGRAQTALDRAADHRERHPDSPWLLLVEAQVRVTRGDMAGLDDVLNAVDRLAVRCPLRPVQDALRVRLRGLAAQEAGAHDVAEDLLREALRGYRDLREFDAAAEVTDDLVRLRSRDGVPDEAGDVDALADPGGTGTSSQARVLTRVLALQAAGRYERALTVLRRDVPALAGRAGTDGPEYALCEAEVRLLRLLRRHAEADGLVPGLYRAAERSAQPERNRALAARFDQERTGDRPLPPGPGSRFEFARDLVAAGRLDEAEAILDAAAAPQPDQGLEAHRRLLDGELALRRGASAHAIDTLQVAARLATGVALATIAIAALRRLAEAHEARGERRAAVSAWAEAHRQEERLAALQDEDQTRIDFLVDVPSEFDEQVRVAYDAVTSGRRLAAASVAIAIEAGRGAAILHRIRARSAPAPRDLPEPGDEAGAWRWVARVRKSLGASRAVWMLHPGPDAVYHVLIDRWGIATCRTGLARDRLTGLLQRMSGYWAHGGQALYLSYADEFARCVRDLAGALGTDDVLRRLPRRVTRIAVVAGGGLSDVPFTALPCAGRDGTPDVLGCRFALSDLPCLSVGEPLRAQALTRRGDTALLVQPSVRPPGAQPPDPRYPDLPGPGSRSVLTAAAFRPGRSVLTADAATPDALRDSLSEGFGTVRIDSHGVFGTHRAPGTDGTAPGRPPALFLWPVRPLGAPRGPGDLLPADLASMSLQRTGTLVVGACRSGMSTRLDRDERTGFVRSGLLGGASAVLAARWDAADQVAARLLDEFEENLRTLPRDVALRQALRTVRARTDAPSDAAAMVCWGGWTLYGDPGPQTRRGPVRRAVARGAARLTGRGRGAR